MRRLAALALFLVCWPAAHAADPAVAQLRWLAGCWSAVGAEPGTAEHWLEPAGGTLLGVSRTVREGRTVAWEFMRIEEREGELFFVARPSGQEEASFRLITLSAGRVVFENATHDFPQRVIYARDGDSLNGRIEGTRNGEDKAIDFPMRKSRCP